MNMKTSILHLKIQGEDNSYYSECNGYITMNYHPFECTQNLQGGYSIILHTFICQATGVLFSQTSIIQFK